MNRSRSNIWLLDLGILLLGVLVMLAVLRLFRFDDPRILYNAWTYCLAVPTVLISSSMLAHVLIPRSAERSIQAGFLLSVLVHLGLTFAAINTVLFSGLWNEGSEQVQMRIKSLAQGTSFQSWSSPSNPTKPEYLRPVENSIDPASQVDLRPDNSSAPKALELLDSNDPTRIEASKAIQDQDLAEQNLTQPELSKPQAQAIKRPELFANPQTRAAIQAPGVEQTPLAQDSLPLANPLSLERTTSEPSPRLERLTQAPTNQTLSPSDPVTMSPSVIDAASKGADRFRIERELDQPIPATDDPSDSKPLPPTRTERLSEIARPTTNIPIELSNPLRENSSDSIRPIADSPPDLSTGPNSSNSSDSIDRLLGSRGELSRRSTASSTNPGDLARNPRNPTTSGETADSNNGSISGAASDTRSNSSNTNGSIDVGDLIKNNSASAVAMRSTSGLPNIGQADSSSLSLDRFRPSSVSNKGTAKGLVPIPAPAFEQRARRIDESNNEELKAMGPLGPKTEESIELGLGFLAKHQRSDGSWRLEDYGQKTVIRSDTAATALALLSFQGAGYSHVQYKYQEECRRALEFLIEGQQSNGDLYRPTDEVSNRNGWLYSHAIATLALCEAYGMTQDENLRINAQRAVDFLVYSQDRQEGGWRYTPRIGSDTSVTGWGMMALKSAELSGLYVPKQTYDLIRKWLENSQASAREKFLYRYNWAANTPETKHGAVPTPVMTSVGLLMRLYTGWGKEDPMMVKGADWLLQRPPALGTKQSPLRDTYYWYYASQVLFHTGGQRWKAWYESLYPMLIESQVTQGPYAGSWEPLGPIPDAWGEYAGRLYVTTLNLLSLEVTYRHLPIYEATSR